MNGHPRAALDPRIEPPESPTYWAGFYTFKPFGKADIISHGTEFTTKMTFIVVTRMMEYAWVLGLHLYRLSPPSMMLAVIGRSQESTSDLGYC